MTHQEEHEDLANKMQKAEIYVEDIYIKYHNGDKERNKSIMAARDAIKECVVLLNSHKSRTADADKHIAIGKNFIRGVKWVAGTLVVTGLGLLVNHLI